MPLTSWSIEQTVRSHAAPVVQTLSMPGLYSELAAMQTGRSEHRSGNVSKATLWDEDVETKTDEISLWVLAWWGLTHSSRLHSQITQEFTGPTTRTFCFSSYRVLGHTRWELCPCNQSTDRKKVQDRTGFSSFCSSSCEHAKAIFRRRGLQADCTSVTADQAFSIFMSLLQHHRLYMFLSSLGRLS